MCIVIALHPDLASPKLAIFALILVSRRMLLLLMSL
ncbi:hypothetical protein BVRB_7g166010 [Beta vulgaris subsp. vulgaris]|nr:hypothetical protein BVRB_7g166010 [Beta vulgaris subsp. vulgaris]